MKIETKLAIQALNRHTQKWDDSVTWTPDESLLRETRHVAREKLRSMQKQSIDSADRIRLVEITTSVLESLPNDKRLASADEKL